MNIINWSLLSNPANWLIVWLMIAFAVLGIHLFQSQGS